MECVAHYEIKSETSVFEDGRWLSFQHPGGLFRARIRNIPRKDFSTPFLLTLYLTFDASDLEEARDVADDRLADCLSILALSTSCSYARHRIRQIVDATPSGQNGMRNCLVWGDSIGHEDPAPILTEHTAYTIDQLLKFDAPPFLRRAMRWYRLGVNSWSPDDQFQYFWFALELVAIAQKSSERISDKCPRCSSALFCQTCQEHPLHKPYEKQAIRALMKAVDKNCDDEKIKTLEGARNALMHGATLREIEHELPQPREQAVDALARIVLLALVNQFPKEILTDPKVGFMGPSTYIHQALSGIVTMQTVVPVDEEGEFDLSFTGMTVSLNPGAPPQSARPSTLRMTLAQLNQIEQLCYRESDVQDMCRRIHEKAKVHGDKVITLVPSTDRQRIEKAIKDGEKGTWQDLFREIVEASPFTLWGPGSLQATATEAGATSA